MNSRIKEKGWVNMHKILDKEMPNTDLNSDRFLLIALSFFIFGFIAGYMFLRSSDNYKVTKSTATAYAEVTNSASTRDDKTDKKEVNFPIAINSEIKEINKKTSLNNNLNAHHKEFPSLLKETPTSKPTIDEDVVKIDSDTSLIQPLQVKTIPVLPIPQQESFVISTSKEYDFPLSTTKPWLFTHHLNISAGGSISPHTFSVYGLEYRVGFKQNKTSIHAAIGLRLTDMNIKDGINFSKNFPDIFENNTSVTSGQTASFYINNLHQVTLGIGMCQKLSGRTFIGFDIRLPYTYQFSTKINDFASGSGSLYEENSSIKSKLEKLALNRWDIQPGMCFGYQISDRSAVTFSANYGTNSVIKSDINTSGPLKLSHLSLAFQLTL